MVKPGTCIEAAYSQFVPDNGNGKVDQQIEKPFDRDQLGNVDLKLIDIQSYSNSI